MRSVEKLTIVLLAFTIASGIIAPSVQAQQYGYCVVTGIITYNGAPCTNAAVTGGGQQGKVLGNGYYLLMLPIGITTNVVATANGSSATSETFTTGNEAKTINLNIVGPDTSTPTPTATPTPTPTPNPNATATPTPTATPTATPAPAPTPTPTPTAAPTASPTPNPASNPAPAQYSNPQPAHSDAYTFAPSPTARVDEQKVVTPSPVPRKVFSSPEWAGDHETIVATNDGNSPIIVKAWIDTPSNNVSATVEPGATMNVSTASLLVQDNQLLNAGFDAYENGAIIDSYKAMLSIRITPTPMAEATTARASGFMLLPGLACISGTAYLALRKRGAK